nr:MAG TPA: hypothetical protein [Caudoviricetes sp.]
MYLYKACFSEKAEITETYRRPLPLIIVILNFVMIIHPFLIDSLLYI